MKAGLSSYVRSQNGFTLVEVVIAVALSAFVMTALTSVVLTSVRASNIASSRVTASSQIRNFEFYAYDDFARSRLPDPDGCAGDPPTTCTIALSGLQASNSATPSVTQYQVTYGWDVQTGFLDRRVGANAVHAATNVTAFSYSVDGASPNQTVVINLTVTVQAYSQSQTFRFYPRTD